MKPPVGSTRLKSKVWLNSGGTFSVLIQRQIRTKAHGRIRWQSDGCLSHDFPPCDTKAEAQHAAKLFIDSQQPHQV